MTITNLQTLTQAEFDAVLRALIERLEGNETLPYYDTTGNPTIGIGFNIYGDKSSMRDKVFAEMGITDPTTIGNLTNIINDADRRARAIAAANAQDWTLLAQINKEMQDALTAAYDPTNCSLFGMTQDQITALYNAEAARRVDYVMTTSGVGYSNELLALVSLEYNAMYGPGTQAALQLPDANDARAETWYQIRYVHVAGQNESRRNEEADLFNLYGAGRGQLMSEEVARATYRMYTRHEVAMKERDGEFVLSAQLQPAASYLVGQYGEGKNFDAVNIFVSPTPSSSMVFVSHSSNIDRSSDTKDVLLIGESSDDTLDGGSGNDVLQGGAGLDILRGGGGDDVLVGGGDADVLEGGTGYDTYFAGDGDTIDDSDASGVVKYNNANLGVGYKGPKDGKVKKGTGGSYESDDGQYTYNWAGEGADLIINGNVTVKNFKNGTMGITLFDREKDDRPKPPPPFVPPFEQNRDVVCPLVLDLDGNGIPITTTDNGVYFDHRGTGFAAKSAWISPSDGFLVRDRNGDGMITTGNELFGDQTRMKDGQWNHNGFDVLAEYDDNHDGKIDAQDSIWSELQIWRDANSDGISQADELHALSDFGIQSIDVAYSQPGGARTYASGHYTKTDGSTNNTVDDPLFASIAWDTKNTELLPVPDDIVQMPFLSGYGKVPDLQQAMVKDTSGALKALVEQFAAEPSQMEREVIFTQILLKWTNSENIDPTSRYNTFYGVQYDARKLNVIEQFNGDGLVQPKADSGKVETNPIPQAVPLLDRSYNALFEMMYSALIAQTQLKYLLNDVTYSLDGQTDKVKVDATRVITDIAAVLGRAAANDGNFMPERRYA